MDGKDIDTWADGKKIFTDWIDNCHHAPQDSESVHKALKTVRYGANFQLDGLEDHDDCKEVKDYHNGRLVSQLSCKTWFYYMDINNNWKRVYISWVRIPDTEKKESNAKKKSSKKAGQGKKKSGKKA